MDAWMPWESWFRVLDLGCRWKGSSLELRVVHMVAKRRLWRSNFRLLCDGSESRTRGIFKVPAISPASSSAPTNILRSWRRGEHLPLSSDTHTRAVVVFSHDCNRL